MSLFDFFRGEKPIQEPAPVKPRQEAYFTTHMELPKPTLNVPSFAMDSACGGSFDNLKSAFTLNQSRVPELLASWYSSQGFIGYQMCAFIAQQWLVDKACRMPAEDATRNGWKVTFNQADDFDDVDVIKRISELDKEYRIVKNARELIQFKRVFGVRIVLFKVKSDDPEYYQKPFNIDGVNPYSYQGIAQIDPYWCVPELGATDTQDPASINYFEPEYWTIGGVKYHRSHLIVVRHSEVADILKPSYLYGGVSLVQQIYERAYAAERSANEAPQLLMTKRMNVVKTDLMEMLANPQKFADRALLQTQMRDNYGVRFIGDEEEYTQHETSLADVDSVIMTQYQLVSAVSGVPATLLLGTSPKGFQSTGEHELRSYNRTLASMQEHDVLPLLERHYQLLLKSEIQPETGLRLKPEVVFNPIYEPSDKEVAEINQMKAQTYATLSQTGAIDGREIADALVKDERSGFEGIDPDQVEELEDDANSDFQ